eukprot:58745_1
MSLKHCEDQPVSVCGPSYDAKTKNTVSTRRIEKMIVDGFIRLSFVHYSFPQDIINIVYAFVTFRNYITIAMVGHVDSGKSTLAGRILHHLRVISDNTLQRTTKEAREMGKESFGYAFLMDRTRDEWGRGLTLHGSFRYQFKIQDYKYSLIDVPGSRKFLKNSVKHLSMADAAILMIPINRGAFETSVAKGNHKKGLLSGMTVIHARLCFVLGVEQLVVAFNKMDVLQREYDEVGCHERFIECKAKVTKILKKIGYKTKKIAFIPISAWHGENIWSICTDKPYFKWYQGFNVKQNKRSYVQGFTLFDALRDVIRPNNGFFLRGMNQRFKMSICQVRRIRGVGDVVRGRVICGGISCDVYPHSNMRLNVYPHSLKYKGHELTAYPIREPFNLSLGSIQKNCQDVDTAECGDIVSLNIKGMTKLQRWVLRKKRGFLSLDRCDSISKPQLVDTFAVILFVVKHPGRLRVAAQQTHYSGYAPRRMRSWIKDENKGIYYVGGYTPTVFVSTWRSVCKMIEIKWCRKRSDSEHKLDPQFIEQGNFAEVIFKPLQPFIVYPYQEIRSYGRVVVLDGNELVLIGKVISVTHSK